MRKMVAALAFATALLPLAASAADWQPTRPVEFVVASGAGGGTDIFARTVQSIIVKYKLMTQPTVVLNKGGGSGAEGFVYVKSAAGDPHKIVFGTNNEWMLPLVAKVGWKYDELNPIAAMAFDEFLLWTKPNAPWKTAAEYVAEAKKRPGEIKMGGSQSKDTDEVLVRMLEKATGIKLTYVPFKSGGEAAVQLAGGHIDSNTNNPAENVGQWKGGQGTPLCVFSKTRLLAGPKVTATMAWSDIPTCKESGVNVEYQMLRGIFMPAGVTPAQVHYYVDLFKKVMATPDWKEFMEKGAFNQTALTGKEYADWVAKEEWRHLALMKAAGFLAGQ